MSLLQFDTSSRLISDASEFLAGGVSSNFRLGMQPGPLVFTHAFGPFLIDADQNRLVDYYLGMGPMILGHNSPSVRQAVCRAMQDGVLFGGQSVLEVEAAKRICKLVPVAERVRFCSSGSEAVQGAIRLARASTNRNTIVKFEGHYHGWFDSVLWSNAPNEAQAGPRSAPSPTSISKGQDASTAESLAILPWNDIALLEDRLKLGDIAAVIMEPAMCNAGAIAPRSGFLEAALEACERNGSLLIFDETITGFRLSSGGAQEWFGVTPHLATFAKAIANGYQVAAIAGPKRLMDMFASGSVLHGGTYNSQLLSMAATIATLDAVSDPEFYSVLEVRTNRLIEGIERILRDAKVPAYICGFPGFLHVGMGLTERPHEYRDLLAVDRVRYSRFCHSMLKRGVRALERGAWFLSAAHTDDVLDQTLLAVREATKEIV
jgi:glutamate-1-semialdehyde 2,1-aminomutase